MNNYNFNAESARDNLVKGVAELAKKQMELGEEAGLNDTKSQRIASEIIERITNQKKAMLEQQQKEAQE